jgi:Zn-finger nucleic acid-binding protein
LIGAAPGQCAVFRLENAMKCPICTVDLVMTDRQGVEIDYCPKCRGVWLDRGEIDKIIERSAALEAKPVPPAPAPAPQPAGFAPAPPPAYAPPPQTAYAPPPPQPGWAAPQGYRKRDDDDDDRYRHQQGHQHGQPYGKKRKSFLSDLLDFD